MEAHLVITATELDQLLHGGNVAQPDAKGVQNVLRPRLPPHDVLVVGEREANLHVGHRQRKHHLLHLPELVPSPLLRREHLPADGQLAKEARGLDDGPARHGHVA